MVIYNFVGLKFLQFMKFSMFTVAEFQCFISHVTTALLGARLYSDRHEETLASLLCIHRQHVPSVTQKAFRQV